MEIGSGFIVKDGCTSIPEGHIHCNGEGGGGIRPGILSYPGCVEYTAAADKAVCSFNVERDPIRYGTVPDRAIAGDIPINVNIPLGTPGIGIKFPPAFDNKVCTGFCPAAGNGNGMAVFNSCVVALAGDDPARPCTCTCP